jgi:hypothetical protein
VYGTPTPTPPSLHCPKLNRVLIITQCNIELILWK